MNALSSFVIPMDPSPDVWARVRMVRSAIADADVDDWDDVYRTMSAARLSWCEFGREVELAVQEIQLERRYGSLI